MAVHILDAMARGGFEEVLALYDERSGLRAFLGIHDTSAGPAFGGIRRFAYRDERSALLDCLRLSLAMSHKCALAGIAGGGGKIVMMDRGDLDPAQAYRHLGRRIERLGGRYYAGPDVGSGDRELAWVQEETRHVAPPGADGPGDLAAATGAGVFAGMRAALRQLDGEEDWPRRTVVIQGLGRVGERIARCLVALGVHVVASERDGERLERVRAELDLEVVPLGEEVDVSCDVFCPCAMGGTLHDLTIQRLAARIVCGAANNPLAHRRHGELLRARGILYLPDFVVNAGAVIRGAEFHLNGSPTSIETIEARIGDVAAGILRMAAEEDASPAVVALREAERRIRRRRSEARPARSR